MSKFLAILLIMPVLFTSACLEKNEIKLTAGCDAGGNEACSAACQSSFNSTAETWRCSGDGHPVCICNSYKDADKYIGG